MRRSFPMKRQPSSATHEAKFADKLGYHRTYVGGLERGERNLTLEAVEHIASRLKLVDGHPRTGPAAHHAPFGFAGQTARATARPTSGHCSPAATWLTSCPRSSRASSTALVSTLSQSVPKTMRTGPTYSLVV